MKLLVFQDFHLKGKNSRNRIGNYFQDCLIKFDEVLSIAQKEKVEAIIDGGDGFETFEPSYRILDAMCDRVEAVKIPVYSLYGNHALAYKHIENSRYTGLAHLFKRSKYFYYLSDANFKDIELIAIEYEHNIEERLEKENLLNFKTDKWRIGIVHAMVMPKPFLKKVLHITYNKIKTNANLILLAHYHHPFTKKSGDTTFLNIGSLGRDNINEAKIEPSICILDTKKRSYKVIKLKSAKKPEEIFDLAKYEELKDNEKSIEEFINTLNSARWQGIDLRGQVELVGKEEKVDRSIINYLLRKIEECENV